MMSDGLPIKLEGYLLCWTSLPSFKNTVLHMECFKGAFIYRSEYCLNAEKREGKEAAGSDLAI